MKDVRLISKVKEAIRLLKKLGNKRYRDAFMQSHTRMFLAQQMRAFRGDRSQAEMGVILDKPQSVISRLEDPTYGKWNLSTLFDVAEKLNKAVIVRFVDPKTFAEFALDVDDDAQNPASFSDSSVKAAIAAFHQASSAFAAHFGVITIPSVNSSAQNSQFDYQINRYYLSVFPNQKSTFYGEEMHAQIMIDKLPVTDLVKEWIH